MQSPNNSPMPSPAPSGQPPAGQMPTGLGGGMPMDDDGEGFSVSQEQATPEEQAQYDQFVDNAYRLIYDEKSQGTVLRSLIANGDPIVGLANTAATIVLHVEQAAERNGTELADGVVLNAGSEIIADLADFAKTAGVYEYTEEDVEGAFYRGIDIYREMKTNAGQIDQDAYAAELGQLIKADQAGTLEKQIPALKRPADAESAPAGPRTEE